MKLSALLQDLAVIDDDLAVRGLNLDSRHTQAGDLFIALQGAMQHGLHHAQQAIAKGAVAVIYDPTGITHAQPFVSDTPSFAIENLGQKVGEIAARFYDHPSKRLLVIGITGTNGKTTCSHLLAQALDNCGVIGTLGWGKPGNMQTTINTTPDALALQKTLITLYEQGCENVAMEVSSHGLEQGRVNAIDFKGAVFTNFSRDHLDYHGSMDSYLQAKLSLFKNPALDFAVINLDDTNCRSVLQTLTPAIKRWGFSLEGHKAENTDCLLAHDPHYSANGTQFQVSWSGETLQAWTPLAGAFNLQNVMTVLCTLLALGWSFEQAVSKLSELKAVSGRMETFGGRNKPTVIVDYAHTPDALEKVLVAARSNGILWTVFGCGGDRDRGKRPEMGRIAEAFADRVIITDDNPRSEGSNTIINDILAGCTHGNIQVIADRQTAIYQAIRQAGPNDCIVIAGKGHENYQEVNGIKTPFSDQATVKQALAAWSMLT